MLKKYHLSCGSTTEEVSFEWYLNTIGFHQKTQKLELHTNK